MHAVHPQMVRGDHKSLFNFIKEKKMEFYGNYLTNEMKLEMGKLKQQSFLEARKVSCHFAVVLIRKNFNVS